MKAKKGFLTVFSLCLFYASLGQDLRLMTYNIKYDNTTDTINNWNYRKEALVQLLKHYEASFIGAQEVLHRQLTYIDSALTGFTYIGVGRDDGRQKGEYSPILYDSIRYKVLKSNTFWLSESPDKISVGWDAALERICTYGLFEEKETSKRLYIFNTHFDHVGKVAREKSAQLLVQKIEEVNEEKLPVVVMGDLNLTPDTAPIQYLRSNFLDGQEATQKPFYGPSGTSNGFDQNRVVDKRIDYIFVRDLKVKTYVHIDDRMENNKHISDHLPVLISLHYP
ncbi:endonuclease/exonuclease/phosphatase family protein [Ulvibacterium sp.]|uniref:endonuclease/exonuclease/phosphatase family protein n=1 Tax=Ulvibacterium sp. TaxID=2665914 RepID=UPI0026219493|nr:endonuclease/exonuclease/phosphatase family protein [Ulvibacterium sp.]